MYLLDAGCDAFIIHGQKARYHSDCLLSLRIFPHLQVGAIENPLTIGPPQEVGVWAGQDIRSRCFQFNVSETELTNQ